MTAVLHPSFVIAVLDADDPAHRVAAAWLTTADEDLVTTPLALAELDRFTHETGGEDAQLALWSDFDRGVYALRWWADGLADTLAVARAHPRLGLVSASLVALAGRLRTTRVVTTAPDFRDLTLPGGKPFEELPSDPPTT